MKRILMLATFILVLIYGSLNAASSGLLFNIMSSGAVANVDITLCLNGYGPMSCQNYQVTGLTLNIKPTILQHVYPSIGIKVNTPGYSIANIGVDCKPISNGLCLFSASNTAPQSISIQSPAPITIPAAPTAVNAIAGTSQATVSWTAPTNSGGTPITGYTITPYIGGSAQTPTTVGDVLTATITGLTNGDTYTFTVTAINAIGLSPASTQSAPITLTGFQPTVPAAPMNIIVTSGNNQASVYWSAPNTNGGSTITSYHVGYYPSSSPGDAITSSCVTSGSVTSCTATDLTNDTPYTFEVTASNSIGTGPAGYASSVTPTSGLSVSPSTLALSGLGGGATRTTTVVNNSSSDVTITGISSPVPALPGLATIITSAPTACTNSTVLTANGGSCTITVDPGSSATSSSGCTNATTVPTPSVITVTPSSGSPVPVNVVILGYACQYQAGYIFAIDDTTPTTSSIGGTVAALADSTAPPQWSQVLISIWGIGETSTINDPIPNTNNPSGGTADLLTGQLNCNGDTDGSCDTNNIYIQYPATNLTNYAAGVCKQTLDNYTDWYLPSICELGYNASGGSSNNCGTVSSPTIQNMLTYLAYSGSIIPFSGAYWSSTEYSINPQVIAWVQCYTGGSGCAGNLQFAQTAVSKTGAGNTYPIRCVRHLTI